MSGGLPFWLTVGCFLTVHTRHLLSKCAQRGEGNLRWPIYKGKIQNGSNSLDIQSLGLFL